MNRTELGSKTAKGGFANERAICDKFNNWKKDKEAQEWLKIMGYNIKKLDSVKAIQIPTRIKKSDVSKYEIEEKEYETLIKFKKADAQNNKFEYKMCNCPREFWEIIIVDSDENYKDGTTIYYHCDYCSEDFIVKDFETEKILFQKQIYTR